MEREKKISIVIITRNREQEVIRALESCLNDSPCVTKEFIIVENASEDQTQELVKKCLDNAAATYHYYALSENLGVAGGRNFGFKKASGDIVFFLDDDAVLGTKNTFQKILEIFETTERCGCVAPSIEQPLDGSNLNGEIFVNSLEEKEEFSYIGTAHALNKRIWGDQALYPEKLGFGSEELYASLFLRNKGYKIIFRPDLQVNHMPSKIERYAGKERAYAFILNTAIIRTMVYPRILLPFIWILFFLRCIKNRCLFPRRIIKDIRERLFSYTSESDRMTFSQFGKLVKIQPIWKLL